MPNSFIAHLGKKGHRMEGYGGKKKCLVTSVGPVGAKTGVEELKRLVELCPDSLIEPSSDGPTESSPVVLL